MRRGTLTGQVPAVSHTIPVFSAGTSIWQCPG
jgi:hypothetical protein